MTYRMMHSRILGGRRLAQLGGSAEPDTTAPTLSGPTDMANGSDGATVAVSTNEGNGTLYWVVTQSGTGPSKAQVKAGQNHLGAAADALGSEPVGSIGAQAAAPTGLVAETSYFAHFLHEDVAGNQSNVVSADGFTTGSVGSGAWVPSDGADTQLWLKTDDDGGAETYRSVRTDSGSDYLTNLYDQIGSDEFSQTTGAKQPVIAGAGSADDDNGNDVPEWPLLDFLAGADTSWGTTSLLADTGEAWSIACAVRVPSGRSNHACPWGIHTDIARIGLRIFVNGAIEVPNRGAFPSPVGLGAGTIQDDTWHVIVVDFDGTDINVRVDGGVSTATFAPGGGSPALGPMLYGARKSSATNTQTMLGRTSDLIVSDASYAFSGGDEGEKIEGYLAHKVGATLDSGHTYFAAPP